MKRLIVAGAILAAASSASADSWFGDCSPVVGVDFKWAQIKNSGAWDNVFPESFPGASVYVGTKFMENFGAELGYDTTGKKGKQASFVANDSVGGATVTVPTGIRSSVRFAGPHLDLVGFWPLENCFEMFVSVGLGWVKPTVQVDRVGGASSNFANDITSITGKGKTIARVGIGANWMATDCIGLRIKALWEDTSRLEVKSNVASSPVLTNFKPWKDSYSLAIGAFLKF
jgi:hypothetical protein